MKQNIKIFLSIHLIKLNYFRDFDNNLNLMTKLKTDYDMFPSKIVKYFVMIMKHYLA